MARVGGPRAALLWYDCELPDIPRRRFDAFNHVVVYERAHVLLDGVQVCLSCGLDVWRRRY